VEEGLKVKTNSEKVKKIRRTIIEMLLPISPTGPIMSLAKKYGVEKSRFSGERTYCILCVRYCAEIKKENAITFIGRGADRKVAVVPEKADVCAMCRECYELCPSGKVANIIGY